MRDVSPIYIYIRGLVFKVEYFLYIIQMMIMLQYTPCLLKLLRKQDTILNIGDFSTKN
jgi:hypothetical protein